MLNSYDNNLRGDQVWCTVGSNTRRRALADAEWNRTLGGRTVLFGDFNAYKPQWNIDCGEIRDATGLEIIIENNHLICNNRPRKSTRPIRSQTT